ncbi:hypothetical protein AMK31_31065 [Streptomyces sp. TSRI0107]|nr:hypothetical protein AMK31_31065 [Streptomyces sp. TSRI0107]
MLLCAPIHVIPLDMLITLGLARLARRARSLEGETPYEPSLHAIEGESELDLCVVDLQELSGAASRPDLDPRGGGLGQARPVLG